MTCFKSNDRSHLIKFSRRKLPSAGSSSSDLLTVCTIDLASAKVACDDFVTCLAAPATAKEVAFGTQIATELKHLP